MKAANTLRLFVRHVNTGMPDTAPSVCSIDSNWHAAARGKDGAAMIAGADYHFEQSRCQRIGNCQPAGTFGATFKRVVADQLLL